MPATAPPSGTSCPVSYPRALGRGDPPLPASVYTEPRRVGPDDRRLPAQHRLGRVTATDALHGGDPHPDPNGFRYGKETITGSPRYVQDALARPL